MSPTDQKLDPAANLLNLPMKTLRAFLTKIERRGGGEKGCWTWLAYKNPDGYGKFRFGPQGSTPWRAHRLSYVLATGDLAEGKHLHHKCENPACVNPNHLEALTPREHIVENTPKSPSAKCAAKTHCQNGHEFNEESARFTKNGKRVCRICNSAWAKAKLAKYRETHPRLKSHCVNGHPLSGDNLYEYATKTGVGRGCRECRLTNVKQYSKRNRSIIKAKERVKEKFSKGIETFSELEREAMKTMYPRNSEYAEKISKLL
jgi:hypothetical protein